MPKRVFIPILITISLFFTSWGFLSHRILHQVAIYGLPEGMQDFYFSNVKELVKTSVNPDVRRKDDPSENTKHFIDMDAPIFKKKGIPETWEKAVKRYTEDTLRKYGTVPWEILKTQKLLTQAFVNKNKDLILLYSSDLGHYVADAHVPLHATINYDGQLTNQKGLHALWETDLPEVNLEEYNLYQGNKAIYLKNPLKEVWNIIRNSSKLVNSVIDLEKKVSLNYSDDKKYKYQTRNGKEERKYSGAFIKDYQKEIGKQVNSQLLLSATAVSSFWYTAWVDAKSPNLSDLFNTNETLLSNLAKEIDVWQKNELLSQKLLRAKNGNN